jgi:hypothetical protein
MLVSRLLSTQRANPHSGGWPLLLKKEKNTMFNFYDSRNGQYPFVIHASPPWDPEPPYPTHTHGLTEFGMPEFIIDPMSFGGEVNAVRINMAFEFFIHPENDHLLQKILNGEIVKLPAAIFNLDLADDPYTYCFREVPSSFEAVKEAYGSEVGLYIPQMRFIQIWVDGDDYALTDEYYRGGVAW